jgi:predicted SprT family Zn-dependent metalloprotease
MAAGAASTPQPYELDIPVTWTCMPSRDEYIAAKWRAWNRATHLTSTASASASVKRAVTCARVDNDHAYDPIQQDAHHERPFVCPEDSGLHTLAQRWSFFRELVATEMEWHGLSQQSWRVAYDRGRRRAGKCVHRSKTLSFSRHLIARGSPADMRNTVLHEISHALAGPTHGHDRTWRTIALQIGCDGKRCHNIELAPATWIYACSSGCWNSPRFKRSHLGTTLQRTCRMCGAACVFVRARHVSEQ